MLYGTYFQVDVFVDTCRKHIAFCDINCLRRDVGAVYLEWYFARLFPLMKHGLEKFGIPVAPL